MTQTEPLSVTFIHGAKDAGWMAGMDLPWQHRALLMWTPLDRDGEGLDSRLSRALWEALTANGALIGLPRQTGSRPIGFFGWLFGQPRRAEFDMLWDPSFEAFAETIDQSLFFAASFDPEAPRPDLTGMAVWHDQGDAPATLFPAGQRTVIRSGVDNFCIGVFCRDEIEMTAFRTALAEAVIRVGGTLSDGPEPGSS